MKLIIFTDLDGTLLNHHDYDYSNARPALDRLKQQQIPLVMVTSKTRREVEPLHRALGLDAPFIVENGGGVFFPKPLPGLPGLSTVAVEGYACLMLGLPYDRIRAFFITACHPLGAVGFGDMPVSRVSSLTGLPENQARWAKEREFTEPFILENPEKADELAALAKTGNLRVTRGGRFYHLMGAGQDKGVAVDAVFRAFQAGGAEKILSIGLGDSENDRLFLSRMDIPILIPHPSRGFLNMAHPRLIRAFHPGSRGWNDAVGEVLDVHAE